MTSLLRTTVAIVVAAGAFALGFASASAQQNQSAWTLVAGGFSQLNDVAAVDTDDIWAVGDGIVHYDGSEWRQVAGLDTPTFTGVDAVAADAVWAVGRTGGGCGRQGVVYRYDGQAWQPERVETHEALYDIHMVTATDGWAVGGDVVAVILRYDGEVWQPVATPEVGGLRAVDFFDDGTGYAVGITGAVTYFNGSYWEARPSLTNGVLLGIDLHGDGVGWIVGSENDRGIILTLVGDRWVLDQDLLPTQFASVLVVAPREVFAVGEQGSILLYDGSRWREVGRTYPGGYGPSALDPDANARPIGQTAISSHGGSRYGNNPNLNNPLLGMDLLPNGEDVLAVGSHGQVVAIEALVPDEVRQGWDYQDVALLTPDHGWAVSMNGPPMRWDGSEWTEVGAHRRLQRLTDVEILAEDEAWAAGRRGVIGRWDGVEWLEEERFTNLDILDIEFRTSTDGWAAAVAYKYDPRYGYRTGVDYGALFHWNGASWTEEMRVCDRTPSDIELDGSTLWVAVGETRLLRHQAGRWEFVPIRGAQSAGGAAPVVTQMSVAHGGGWAGGWNGVARLRSGQWQAVIPSDDEPVYGPRYPFFRNVVSLGPDAGLFQSGGLVYLITPDGAQNVLRVTTSSTTLAAVADGGGGHLVWLVGSGGTLVRGHVPTGDIQIPGPTPELPTPVLPPAEAYPTPTPHSAHDTGAVVDALAEVIGVEAWAEVDLHRVELVSYAVGVMEVSEVLGRFHRSSTWWWGPSPEPFCTDPVWIVEISGDVLCGAGGNYQVMLFDGRSLEFYQAVCGALRQSAFLPVAYAPQGERPTPMPTTTPRPLDPVPAHNGLDAPCPTPTPVPTRDWPGYPGP